MKLQIIPVLNKIFMTGLYSPQKQNFGTRTAYDTVFVLAFKNVEKTAQVQCKFI